MSTVLQTYALRLETDAISMVYIGITILCFLFTVQCSLYEGSAVNSKQLEEQITLQKQFIDDWKCNSNLDCTVINSNCVNSTCQCSPGYVYNGEMTSCVKIVDTYGDKCNESIQCSRYLLSGATCLNNICICSEGYYYAHGRCIAYTGLNKKCHQDYDCYVFATYGATFCDKGICKCSPGFYQREYRTCRPKAKDFNDECLIRNDCAFNNTAYCNDEFKCVVESVLFSITNFIDDKIIRYDFSVELSIEKKCTTNENCKQFDNTVCGPLGKCVCKRAYFLHENGKCVPELGEPCLVNDTAHIERSECKYGKWNCKSNQVASVDNRSCRKANRKYNYSCNFDEQCHTFGPDAVCNNERCLCNENSQFIESELFCWVKRKIGDKCQQSKDCYVNDKSAKPSCKNNICSCPKGTQANAELTACEERVTGINSTCTKNSDCPTENSECKSNRCTCKKNYVAISVDSCLPVVGHEEPCENDLQCSATMANAVCIGEGGSNENKTCDCAANCHYKFKKCYKTKDSNLSSKICTLAYKNIEISVLGSRCDYLGECYLNSDDYRVVCKNNRCSCNWGYVKANDTTCRMDSNTQRYNNGK
ncbi:prion-like-(Q/N-rich) domain-bearing protein 25 [Colletes gigas]|uniref:prion-like-(Q/N-rich) domain-bearing protein 25 n=1 Tax=Colletes gigas TaxID=935657 RepID=UPI001C9A95D4|nr:prion-like-(Q/N-rich) domain-bearing protein 25 [Colletes gigas]